MIALIVLYLRSKFYVEWMSYCEEIVIFWLSSLQMPSNAYIVAITVN